MTSLVDTLPSVHLSTFILPRKLSPKSDVILEDNNQLVDQLSEQYEQSRLFHSNGMR
jgi:hypothetical protein